MYSALQPAGVKQQQGFELKGANAYDGNAVRLTSAVKTACVCHKLQSASVQMRHRNLIHPGTCSDVMFKHSAAYINVQWDPHRLSLLMS